MIQFRQGDVYLRRVDAIPSAASAPVAREQGRLVLAHGEATGHAHAITSPSAAMFRDPKLNELFLRTDAPVNLVHDEHTAIELPVGFYQVVRQREYDDRPVRGSNKPGIRLVADFRLVAD